MFNFYMNKQSDMLKGILIGIIISTIVILIISSHEQTFKVKTPIKYKTELIHNGVYIDTIYVYKFK